VYKDDYYQGEAGDFLLWKAWRKSDGDIFWRTGLGKGRPGWHIECSAMSARFLGLPFDIHAGGVDNIFAHHENEIAQSEGATGVLPARCWFHVRHLLMEGRKMSKSLGNIYTVDALLRMGFGSDAIRAHLLSAHYRRRLNFTFRALRATERELGRCKRLLSFLSRRKFWDEDPSADRVIHAALSEFTSHIENDLDTPRALRTFCSLVRKLERLARKKRLGPKNAARAHEALIRMNEVLGIIR